VGYENPFPYIIDAGQKAQLDQLLLAFNGQIQSQATLHDDTFVPTAQVINVADFPKYPPKPQSIHLSLLGYQVVASEFWNLIKLFNRLSKAPQLLAKITVRVKVFLCLNFL